MTRRRNQLRMCNPDGLLIFALLAPPQAIRGYGLDSFRIADRLPAIGIHEFTATSP